MWRLNKPSDNPREVFMTCISRIRNINLKERLESVADIISEAAEEYDQNGLIGNIFIFQEQDDVNGIIRKEEMEKVYTIRMAKKKTPGRPIYDKLLISPPNGTCPICGHGKVSTLDHYLPKSSFPAFVVTPYNLIPACSDCNKHKSTAVATCAEEQVLHPYYDNVEDIQWLYAEVIEEFPASVRFFVHTEGELNNVLEARIQEHFTTFELGFLYSSQAGAELADIRYSLNRIYQEAGPDQVREHLNQEFISRQKNHINSWRTAMYQAMTNSDWFCNGGFNI